ncbi:MAG: hypothetical protein HY784_13195 [Chloroflexi bacterium]|nr:hypothetical protein [Chloroflexota bacterium]
MLELAELIAAADDAYYAAEYDLAIQRYREVLRRDPGNQRAQEQLGKAELNQVGERPSAALPRAAIQLYKRARSYVAAGDVEQAADFLEEALDMVEKQRLDFPDAKILLDNLENAQVAAEIKKSAEEALEAEQWSHAVRLYERVLKLDATDDVTKGFLKVLKDLLKAEARLKILDQDSNSGSRSKKLQEIREVLDAAAQHPLLSQTTLLEQVAADLAQVSGPPPIPAEWTARISAFFLGLALLIGGVSVGTGFQEGSYVALALLAVAIGVFAYGLLLNWLSRSGRE